MSSVIGVGNYRKEDYPEILRISEDRQNLDETWKKWKSNKDKTTRTFRQMGLKTVDVLVIPKELVKYCRERGLKINGQSRSAFVSYMTKELYNK